jgi:7-carboxy-7-deazaguanine synthase
MRIAEIYRSIQGEGLLTGTDSVFIRASGCNLRCWFCDTPHTSWSPEGEDLSVDEIVARTLALECEHIVLTGGEPMLFAELIPLASALRAAEKHITIETAGTLYLPVACDLMSVSPKLANSTPTEDVAGRWRERHERDRHAPEVIHRLIDEYPYQFKFVVDRREDVDDVERYLAEFPKLIRSRVMLMPQGIDPQSLAHQAEWLEPFCREHNMNYCPRKHIEWFGGRRGT